MSEKVKDNRYRDFATVVYPESAPEHWQIILEELCVPSLISPLHDSDVNPDGEPKKAHYHVMLMFDGKKSMDSVCDLVKTFGGVGCIRVQNKSGYARYLCHLDNPEKAKYDEKDIRGLAGADYYALSKRSVDKYIAISEIIEFCEDNDIESFYQLLLFCKDNQHEWYRVLCDNGTFVIKEYLKSKRWTRIQQRVEFRKSKQDVEKGE